MHDLTNFAVINHPSAINANSWKNVVSKPMQRRNCPKRLAIIILPPNFFKSVAFCFVFAKAVNCTNYRQPLVLL